MGSKMPEQEKTEQQRAQEFIEEYNALCEKHGLRISVIPAFVARDDGTWSVVLQTGVDRLPSP